MGDAVRNTGIVSITIAVLSLTAVLLYLETKEKETNNVCNTTECIKQAAKILSAMDTITDPCTDFYQYACGGWIKNNPIPETRGVHSQFHLSRDAQRENLRGSISSDHTKDREAIKKAKMFYKACVNEELLNRLDTQPAFDWIDTVGGFPLFGSGIADENFALEKYLADATAKQPPILFTTVYSDLENSSKHLIFVDQPSLLMPDRQFYLSENFNSIQIVFRNFLRDFLTMLWKSWDMKNNDSTFNADALDDAVSEIYQLEKDLAEIIIPQEKLFNIAKVFRRVTLEDAPDKFSSEFDWSAYVKAIFSKIDRDLEDNTEIGTVVAPYLSDMMQVLKKYNNSVIQNYVVVYNLARSLSALPKNYRDLLSEYRKAITGASEEEKRWKVCVSKATSALPMAVGAILAESSFSEDTRKQILEMTDIITKSFADELDKLDWMDDETRKTAKLKVDALVPMMVYPEYIVNATDPKLDDEYKYAEIRESELFKSEYSLAKNALLLNLAELDEPVDRSKWHISPATINAYFEPSRNVMVFPAGFLRPPVYSAGQPFASNFGAIGLFIGHELTHGFDRFGASYDENGNLRNWWTNSSRADYNKAEKCFVEQFNNYVHKPAGQNVNGELTITENVADSGAIRQAFRAYQIWKMRHPNKEFSLPGLEKYTPEQLLFISSAQVFCEAQTPKEAIKSLIDDSHSPGPLRVKGPFHNFGQFGKTFQCKQGVDEMYRMPSDRCSLW